MIRLILISMLVTSSAWAYDFECRSTSGEAWRVSGNATAHAEIEDLLVTGAGVRLSQIIAWPNSSAGSRRFRGFNHFTLSDARCDYSLWMPGYLLDNRGSRFTAYFVKDCDGGVSSESTLSCSM